MIWIVTTDSEAKTICHQSGLKDFRSVMDTQVSVITALDRSDLNYIKNGDIVISRTKKPQVLNWIRLARVRSTAESSFTMQCDYDKEFMKYVCRKSGINAPQSYTLSKMPEEPFKVFVKPLNLGDSIGIDSGSICFTRNEVFERIGWLSDRYGAVGMIEEFIDGYDCTVGILNTPKGIVTGAVSIGSDAGILDYDTKENDKERYERIDDPAIKRLAIEAFTAIGATKYGRIDIRISKEGIPYVIEANLCPGLSRNGYMYKCFEDRLDYRRFCRLILCNATI